MIAKNLYFDPFVLIWITIGVIMFIKGRLDGEVLSLLLLSQVKLQIRRR